MQSLRRLKMHRLNRSWLWRRWSKKTTQWSRIRHDCKTKYNNSRTKWNKRAMTCNAKTKCWKT